MKIESIELRQVLPEVFASGDSLWKGSSDVWLDDIEMHRGNITMIEAESGTGKSSLCAFLYGSRTDYKGQILFDGKDISGFTIKEWCRLRERNLAYLPQEMRLFPELTVRDNIEIKNRLTRFKTSGEIKRMLECLGVDSKLDVPARLLSIGQQQRVAIVRSLCQPFDFLMLDEPVSHLDKRNNDTVATLIMDEVNRQGAGVIATSVGYSINLPFHKHLAL